MWEEVEEKRNRKREMESTPNDTNINHIQDVMDMKMEN